MLEAREDVLVLADLDGQAELEVLETETEMEREGRSGWSVAKGADQVRSADAQLELLADVDLLAEAVRLRLDRVEAVVEHNHERCGRVGDRHFNVGDANDCTKGSRKGTSAQDCQRLQGRIDSLLTNTFACDFPGFSLARISRISSAYSFMSEGRLTDLHAFPRSRSPAFLSCLTFSSDAM